MEGGLNAQDTPLGKPLHESDAAVLNPKLENAFIIDVAEFPAVSGEGDKAPAENSKPGGVVLRITPSPFSAPPGADRFHKKTKSVRPSPFMSP